MATVIDSESGITAVYTYDLIGRLARYTETGTNHNVLIRYTYDQEGKLTYLAETINGEWRGIYYYYDTDNRVRLVEKGNGGRGYTYDDFGRVSQKYTRHVGYTRITDDFVYTTNGNATSAQVAQHIITTGVGTDNVVATTYSYTYDDNGNITSVTDGTNTTSCVYDSANQLIRENNQAGGFTHTWTYDSAGNILSRMEYGYTTGSLEGVTPTDTVNYTYGDDSWGDLLTAYNSTAITYDGMGNPLNDGTWTYTWQHGRELASMTDGTVTWNYTYNADGLRIKRTNGTANYSYVYNGSELEKMTVGTEQLAFAYDADGVPLTIRWGDVYYFYITNLQGDVIAITDQNGTVVVQYTYDAWGNILSTTGTMATTLGQYNPLRYRGYVYDQETGLYYLQSRYYDPEIGRFINADNYPATGQGLTGNNMFAYCGNNPVKRVDSGGYFWDIIFDVVSLVGSVVEVVQDPSDVGAWVGLAGDVVDVVVPFVSGVGEISRAVSAVDKVVDAVDDIHDANKVIETATDLHRPYIRKSTREVVEKAAARAPDGRFLDANTGKPISGKYDLGHTYGHEFWREREKAMSLGWTQKQFNDYMNNPAFYRIEDPHNNRSHRFEMTR